MNWLKTLALVCALSTGLVRAEEVTSPAGAVQAKYSLPDIYGRNFPVLSAGTAADGVVIFVARLSAQSAVAGCEFVGKNPGVVYSEPFPLGQGAFDVQVALVRLASGVVAFDRVWVSVEGQTRLNFPRAFTERGAPAWLGENRVGGHLAIGYWPRPVEQARALSLGEMRDSLDQLGRIQLDGRGGFIAEEGLALRVGMANTHAPAEALLSSECAGVWRALGIRHEGSQSWLEWMMPGQLPRELSARFESTPGMEQNLRVRLSGMAEPRRNRDEVLRANLVSPYTFVLLEDQLILWAELGPSLADENRVFLGRVPQVPATAPFSGGFFKVESIPLEALFNAVQSAWRTPQDKKSEYRGYPCAYALKVEIPYFVSDGKPGLPLVASGITGIADIVHWVWVGPGRAKIGFDHWGIPSLYGSEFEVPSGPISIEVIHGGLVPPDHPLYEKWRRRARVSVEGRVVLDVTTEINSVDPRTIRALVNFPGGSSTEDSFRGRIVQVKALGVEALTP